MVYATGFERGCPGHLACLRTAEDGTRRARAANPNTTVLLEHQTWYCEHQVCPSCRKVLANNGCGQRPASSGLEHFEQHGEGQDRYRHPHHSHHSLAPDARSSTTARADARSSTTATANARARQTLARAPQPSQLGEIASDEVPRAKGSGK